MKESDFMQQACIIVRWLERYADEYTRTWRRGRDRYSAIKRAQHMGPPGETE